MDHLGSGKDWDLARKSGGLVLLPPFGAVDNDGLYKNRLEALKGITGFLNRRTEDYVILCDCDGVYRMDLSEVLDFHEEKGADITFVCHSEAIENSSEYTTITSDSTGRVTGIQIKNRLSGKHRFYSNIMVIGRQFLLKIMVCTSGNFRFSISAEPSVEALSATITATSAPADSSSGGRNFSISFSPFQLSMTTAVFIIRCLGSANLGFL